MFHYTVFGLVFPAPDKMPRISGNAKSVLSTVRECWLGFVNSCRMGLVKLNPFPTSGGETNHACTLDKVFKDLLDPEMHRHTCQENSTC